jgi:Mn2+/Fe2+ NRAMP family transporter
VIIKSTLKKFNTGSPLLAAAFLMATSAIGPGFLTQTAVFTQSLGASFGFIILLSVILDIGAQLNIWSILCLTGLRAQELSNKVVRGSGIILTFLIVTGGLAFNSGNLGGAGLGLNVITGWSIETGACISAFIALFIFFQKRSLTWLDVFAKVLGMVMIALTLYVVFVSNPPIAKAIQKTVVPDNIDWMAIMTLVGGTVGGYISFAGAHRLIDGGLTGTSHVKEVKKSAVSAIVLASIMRVLLFLAALGVVEKGLTLDSNNPPASVFQLAAGNIGYILFGIVMWSAAITSVVGSAYTSVSFLKSYTFISDKKEKLLLSVFVLISLLVIVVIGKPVNMLIAVGALNGFVLPLALIVIIRASFKKEIVGNYIHPRWLQLFGIGVILATLIVSIKSVMGML